MTVNIDEFKQFHKALTTGRPGYKPWYFMLNKGEKDPLEGQGWKAGKHQLSFQKACDALKMGYNIGIAGTDKDGLVIIDVDDKEAFKNHTFIPTLTAKSSSRVGMHHFYFTLDPNVKVNIPLEHAGELRTNWQYVVAPGSYAKLSDSKDDAGNITKTADDKLMALPDTEKEHAGKYTLESIMPPDLITYADIPQIFKDEKEKREVKEKAKLNRPKGDFTKKSNSNNSALFDLSIDDVVTSITDRRRHPSLFHDSHTGKNTSISDELLHCWRHNVSHNAISALSVMAGIYDCVDAGTGHKNSGSGSSCIDYDDGETIFKIWNYAKENGYISKSDSIPAKAMTWLALENNLCKKSDLTDGWKLPNDVFIQLNNVLKQEKKQVPKPKPIINNSKNLVQKTISKMAPPGLIDIANELQKNSPIYYDTAKIFWLWTGSFYEMVDETDIQIAIMGLVDNEKMYLGSAKNAIMDAIKITGRMLNVQDKPKTWVQLEDCIIDISTGEFIESDPHYLLTKPLPHKYSDSTDTPTFDKLFIDWVGKENKLLLYEICAYVLLDDYPIHRLFLLFGRGRNGKGQFREILTRLVGKDNTTSSTIEGLMHNRFETSRLYKKKLVTIGEANYGLLEDTSIIKMLTGGDMIPGEFKNKNPFDFYNTAKIVINSNSLPPTSDKTDAFYSRFLIVPFSNQFLVKNRDVIDDIPDYEYDNLIAKCIGILRTLLDNGGFTNEGSIAEKTKIYESLSNPLSDFIMDKCITNNNGIVPIWQFIEDYNSYLNSKNLRQLSDLDIRKQLQNSDYALKKNHVFKQFVKNGQWTGVVGLFIKENNRLNILNTEFGLNGSTIIVTNSNMHNRKAKASHLDSLDSLDTSHSASMCSILSEVPPNTPNTPNEINQTNLDQSIKMFEAVKKEVLNSTNVKDFINMVKKTYNETTDEYIISYLIKIGKIANKNNNGDKSCVECGEPGKHKSKVSVDRNTDRTEYRCDACYEQYQQGKVVS